MHLFQYRFYDKDESECPNYLTERGINVGCVQPYQEQLRFNTFYTKLSLGTQEHHLKNKGTFSETRIVFGAAHQSKPVSDRVCVVSSQIKSTHQHDRPKWIWLQPVLLLEHVQTCQTWLCEEWGPLQEKRQELGGKLLQNKNVPIFFFFFCLSSPSVVSNVSYASRLPPWALGGRVTASTCPPEIPGMNCKCGTNWRTTVQSLNTGVTGASRWSGDPTTAPVKLPATATLSTTRMLLIGLCNAKY